MIAVIFEVYPTHSGSEEYLEIAGRLKEHLSNVPGFISIERFQSLSDPNKLLSLSFWEDESFLAEWRNFREHRSDQQKGKDELFARYRIRVGSVIRDYTDTERSAAPKVSNEKLLPT